MNVLLLGPLYPPIHGQSMAFTRFAESLDGDKIIIDVNLDNKSKVGKLFGNIRNIFLIIFKSLFFKYDIVYFTCSRSLLGSIKDVILINLVSLKKVKIINHLHGSDFIDLLENSSNLYKKILIKTYNKVDTSIVLLESMKSQFKDFDNMKIEVVSNFYDKEFDKKLIEKKDKEKINLVYLSNIVSSKGIFELIEAFEQLSKKYKNICLNIAGGFIADENLSIDEVKEKFNNQINKNDRISFFGKVFGEDKIKLLQSSDIFILPTYYKSEAFPISIIEAMASENAIVTSNYKYLPEIISEKNGVLVDVKSVNSLLYGIESLIKDRERLKKIQSYNKKEAIEKYSLEKYVNNLKNIVFGE